MLTVKNARPDTPGYCSYLSTVEFDLVLQDDELIAKRRIIDKWGQMDVAAELGWYRSTVSDHEKYIFQRVEEVAKQLYTNKGAGN